MTGAGFGGCTVNLLPGDRVDEFQTVVTGRYERETGLSPCVYACRASDGLRVANV
jgi:galactokinase